MKKVTAFDVPVQFLIEDAATEIGKSDKIKRPVFIDFIKTGAHRERQPTRPDWFPIRMASILYRVYKDGPVGTGSLRSYYGGRKNRGVKPHKFTEASGKIIRLSLQNLEALGYIKKAKKGREITSTGQQFLTNLANGIYSTLEERKTQLTKTRLERQAARLARERETKAAGATSARRPEDDKKKDKKGDKGKKEKEGKQ